MQKKTMLIKNSYVIIILSVCALFIPIILTEYGVLKFTGGIFSYPLDDTYIHMSIAKNFAQNNTWGINAQQFSAASSSILYTILLAILFKIFSANILIPFILNAVIAIILLVVIQKRLEKENVGFTGRFIILFLVIFFTPLSALVISGMEHTLQCLFSFLFLFNFNDWWNKAKNNPQKKVPASMYINGILVCAIRYEGLFLVGIVCFILLLNKKIISAFVLGFISLLPIIIFGIYSVSKGSYFFPNSVLLKATPVELSSNGAINFISNILIDKLTLFKNGITSLATQRLLLILPLTYLMFKNFLSSKHSYAQIIFVLTVCTLLQLSFASTGWFYRYEAYLVLCSVVIIGLIISKYAKPSIASSGKKIYPAIIFVFLILIFPLVLRTAAAYTKAKQACINIYEQQNQMGNFIKKYYGSDTVAVNDIGAVSFFKQNGIVDLWGLADIDVAKSKRNNYSTPAFLYNLANKKDVKLAVVYDSWFDSSLLKKWQKVATWQIKNNVICGDSIVSFYAVKNNIAPALKTNLEDYQKSLPPDVNVKYY
jgi:hypothetical protein